MKNTVETTDDYWDCECEFPENYIWPKDIKECDRCGAKRDEQPNSRVTEVAKFVKEDNNEATNMIEDKDRIAKLEQLSYDIIDFLRILEENGYLRIPKNGYYKQVLNEIEKDAKELKVV